MNDTPKELYVINFDSSDYPIAIHIYPVVNYDRKDNTGKIQVTDIYSSDEAVVDTGSEHRNVRIGVDASDELEIALRIALHKLDLRFTFLHLDAIGCFQQLVLADTPEKLKEAAANVKQMTDKLQQQYDAAKYHVLSLFQDACNFHLETSESAPL